MSGVLKPRRDEKREAMNRGQMGKYPLGPQPGNIGSVGVLVPNSIRRNTRPCFCILSVSESFFSSTTNRTITCTYSILLPNPEGARNFKAGTIRRSVSITPTPFAALLAVSGCDPVSSILACGILPRPRPPDFPVERTCRQLLGHRHPRRNSEKQRHQQLDLTMSFFFLFLLKSHL